MNHRSPQVFHILWSFTLTFLIARGLVYLSDIKNTLPDVYFSLFGYHLHHFNLGILAMGFAGYAAITNLKIPKKILAILFGFGLGLTVDEFGLLISLQDDYWLRQTYDVVVILLVILINIEYFSSFWRTIIKNILGQSKKKEVLEIKSYPKVSVVIPAYNEEAFLPQTLESLKNQDYQGQIEIIVADNGSTDNTTEIAKKYGARVILEPQKGVQFARQTGFENATGEFIVSTDADNTHPKDWLTNLATRLLVNKDLAAFGGWFKLKDGNLLPHFVINNLSPFFIGSYSNITGKKVLIGQNFIVRKSQFVKTNGFRNLDPMDEDVQFAQRLSTVGNVEIDFAPCLKVTTSPRRWQHSFILDIFPYVVNGLSLAATSRVIFKGFKDERSETSSPFVARLVPYLAGILVIILLAAIIPANPVHAKVAPITKKARIAITSRLHYHRSNY